MSTKNWIILIGMLTIDLFVNFVYIPWRGTTSERHRHCQGSMLSSIYTFKFKELLRSNFLSPTHHKAYKPQGIPYY